MPRRTTHLFKRSCVTMCLKLRTAHENKGLSGPCHAMASKPPRCHHESALCACTRLYCDRLVAHADVACKLMAVHHCEFGWTRSALTSETKRPDQQFELYSKLLLGQVGTTNFQKRRRTFLRCADIINMYGHLRMLVVRDGADPCQLAGMDL